MDYDFTLLRRFWENVEVSDGCWLWRPTVDRADYGTFGWLGMTVPTHRLAYEMFIGPVPSLMCVCHTCDNPACVRPDHLFLGTKVDNSDDRDVKGRTRHGSGSRALTMEQAQDVRERVEAGTSQKMLAEEYKVSRLTIWRIVNNETYTDAP